MPKSIRLVFCGLVINIYSEEGAPHHEIHVEVAKEGGREYKANFCVQTGKLLAGRLKNKHEEEMVREIIATYKDKLLNDWEGLNSNDRKVNPRVLVIKHKNELICGLTFWPILHEGEKCVAVSYKGSTPPAIFDLNKVKLLSPGSLQKRKQDLAKKAILQQKERWLEELETHWQDLESSINPLSFR